MSSLALTIPLGRLCLRPEAGDPADAAFLFALFASTKAEEMACMPLDEAGRAFLLTMQFRSMTESYRRQFPSARFEIATLDGVAIGRLITDVRADCVYYAEVALLPAWRGGDIATALMIAALDEPRRLGKPARVMVLVNNTPSLCLCRRIGFIVRVERPPFLDLEWRTAPALPRQD